MMGQIIDFLKIEKSEFVEMSDLLFASKLNFENIENGRDKIRNARISLMIDQKYSGCEFIEIIPGSRDMQTGDYISTVYRTNRLFEIFELIRDEVVNRRILDILDVEKRENILNETITEILLRKLRLQRVPPGAHKKESKSKAEIRIDKLSLNKKRELVRKLNLEIYLDGLRLKIDERNYWRNFNSDVLRLEDDIARANNNVPQLRLVGAQPK